MKLPPLGIRARTTLISTVVVGVALLLGSIVLIFTVTSALRASIKTAAATRAADVSLIARTGSLPRTLTGRGDSLLVQVVRNGVVVSSSSDLSGQPAMTSLTLRAGKVAVVTLPTLDAAGDRGFDVEPRTPYLVIGRGVTTPKGPATILVASSLSPVKDTSGLLVPILLVGSPIVLLLVAFVTWWLTGVALQPVAAMRRRAETISSSAPEERLPVPKANDEIHDLAETMNSMLARIEAAGIAQRQFTSDASHELKSPIAAMRTMLEVARRAPERADLSELFDDLLTEDRRLELLVADLLLLGRGDEDEIKLDLKELDLAKVVAEEISSVSRRAGLEIVSDISGPVEMVADEGRIRQLLRNLLDNAVRHAEGCVWVDAKAEYGDAVLHVADDGPGIPREQRERVFQRFVRLDEGRGRGEGGTGLGLPVCRAIAHSHGGLIRIVESSHGGATFEVRLPLEPAGQEAVV